MIAMIFFASNFRGAFSITTSENEFQDLILGVAQGVVSKQEIARFFRKHSESYKKKKF